MPTINKRDKVIVTGVNGYIAMWTARFLLERGYAVRGTVRSGEKAKFVKDYFSSIGYGDRFEIAIVEDIAKKGAFDEAVKGVDAIVHMASPVHKNPTDNLAETLDPVIQGTVGVLESAQKNGKHIKRIVITSSCAAVLPTMTERPTVYIELDWNTESPKLVEENGVDAPPGALYCASKVLSEKEAWDYYEKYKADAHWDLSVINPCYVYGPAIHDIQLISSLNLSLALWYDAVVSNETKTKEAMLHSDSWVDVRDVALAHILALEKPEAGGERIITSAGGYIWQEWLNAANTVTSSYPSNKLPVGFPELLEHKVYNILYDKSKQERILDIKYRTMLETTKDTLEDFAKRGW